MTNNTPSTLILHQSPGAWGLPSLSPFCLKLDTYLRMVGISFQSVTDPSPFKGPKKKLPWIEHDGKQLGDSGFIIEYLENRYRCSTNTALSNPERALAHALRRLIEENLAWALAYDRWVLKSSGPIFRDIILGSVPAPLRLFIAPLASHGVRRQLDAQGMGRHSPNEVYSIAKKDIGAIADVLADKTFLMGDKPTDVDASAYGVLANVLKTPLASPMKDEVLRHANLVGLVERIQGRYFA